MTDREHGGSRAIRITLHGDMASDVDVDALKKWLERERSLEVWINDNKLRIHERARPVDARDAPTMGAGMEILLVMAGAMTPRLFDELLAATKAGVEAWRENRRSVEEGTPPVPEVTPLPSSDSGPDAPDSEGG